MKPETLKTILNLLLSERISYKGNEIEALVSICTEINAELSTPPGPQLPAPPTES